LGWQEHDNDRLIVGSVPLPLRKLVAFSWVTLTSGCDSLEAVFMVKAAQHRLGYYAVAGR
jgi:hypothetical protein